MKGCIIANNVCKLSWLSVNPNEIDFYHRLATGQPLISS